MFVIQEGGDDRGNGTRIWSRTINSVYGVDRGYVDDEDDSDDEGEDRSLDLLIKFVQNVFRKISKRAKKAVRSVLPLSIPNELVIFLNNLSMFRSLYRKRFHFESHSLIFASSQVGFSVNGVLILAFLWVLKAFLEVT